jgi:Nucleoside-diphosphate-sugar pyrophosphorylase involved in lipopolysaccharide biosynthesis/translation initiation factor 2B, gamma/epsilon subunits (eIF-2Bgamma/eIF-2Bepsilon)
MSTASSLKAVILAGGYGKRLRPLTDERPKPMIEVGGRPIVEWQILWLKRFGIKSFVS